jgi:hypothetical protein
MNVKFICNCIYTYSVANSLNGCLHAAEHRWLKEGGASDRPIDSAVLSRMKQFKAMNKLKQLALKVRILLNRDNYYALAKIKLTRCLLSSQGNCREPITRGNQGLETDVQ